MYAIFAAMFMTQLKAIQITVSLQAPLLLISQMTGAAHSAALAKAISPQKRKRALHDARSGVKKATIRKRDLAIARSLFCKNTPLHLQRRIG